MAGEGCMEIWKGYGGGPVLRLRCGAVSIAKVGSFACLLEYEAFIKLRTSQSLQTGDFGDSIECCVLIL